MPFATSSFAIYLTPRMLLLAWLGLISGVPLALTASTLTAWLADSGLSVKTIGLFALVGIPYTFKFLWAPLMDGLTPPLGRLLGKRRAWMVWWLLALAACVFALSLMDVKTDITWIALLTVALAFCSATFDINLDALRIDWLPDEEQGAGAAMAVFGYRVGMIISSAGALYLAAIGSWQLAYQGMTVVLLLGLIPTLLAKNPTPVIPATCPSVIPALSGDPEPLSGSVPLISRSPLKAGMTGQLPPMGRMTQLKQWLVTYVVTPFKQFAEHPHWWLILIFILLFKLGDAVLGIMTMPFLINKAGYEIIDIAEIVKVYGLLATIIGGFIGGWIIIRIGIFKSLILGGLLQSAANLPYVYLALLPETDNLALGITIAIDNAFGGFATTAFIAYISSLCNKRFTATQYALLNSLASVGRTFISSSSGVLSATMGWPLFFVFTALLGLPSLVLLIAIRKTYSNKNKS